MRISLGSPVILFLSHLLLMFFITSTMFRNSSTVKTDKKKKKDRNEKRSRLLALIKERAEKRLKKDESQPMTLLQHPPLPSAECASNESLNLIPLNDKIYILPKLFFDAFNKVDFEEILRILTTYCTPDITVVNQYDGEEDPVGIASRRVFKGVDAVMGAWRSWFSSAPDIIFFYHSQIATRDSVSNESQVTTTFRSEFTKKHDFEFPPECTKMEVEGGTAGVSSEEMTEIQTIAATSSTNLHHQQPSQQPQFEQQPQQQTQPDGYLPQLPQLQQQYPFSPNFDQFQFLQHDKNNNSGGNFQPFDTISPYQCNNHFTTTYSTAADLGEQDDEVYNMVLDALLEMDQEEQPQHHHQQIYNAISPINSINSHSSVSYANDSVANINTTNSIHSANINYHHNAQITPNMHDIVAYNNSISNINKKNNNSITYTSGNINHNSNNCLNSNYIDCNSNASFHSDVNYQAVHRYTPDISDSNSNSNSTLNYVYSNVSSSNSVNNSRISEISTISSASIEQPRLPLGLRTTNNSTAHLTNLEHSQIQHESLELQVYKANQQTQPANSFAQAQSSTKNTEPCSTGDNIEPISTTEHTATHNVSQNVSHNVPITYLPSNKCYSYDGSVILNLNSEGKIHTFTFLYKLAKMCDPE